MQVLLLGSSKAFGNWNPSNAVVLTKVPLVDWWWADVMIPVGDTISFKFAIRSEHGSIIWEPILDRSATAPDSLSHTFCFEFGQPGLLAPHEQVSPQLLRAYGALEDAKDHSFTVHAEKAEMEDPALWAADASIRARLEAATVGTSLVSSKSAVVCKTGSSTPFSSAVASASSATVATAAAAAVAVSASSALAGPLVVRHGLSAITRARLRVLTRPPPQLTKVSASNFGRDFILEKLRATRGKLREGFSSGKSRITRSDHASRFCPEPSRARAIAR